MKKFWYVHNRRSGNPFFRHSTLESAIEEAKRLSKKYNKNFYVLESVYKVTAEGEVDNTITGYGDKENSSDENTTQDSEVYRNLRQWVTLKTKDKIEGPILDIQQDITKEGNVQVNVVMDENYKKQIFDNLKNKFPDASVITFTDGSVIK